MRTEDQEFAELEKKLGDKVETVDMTKEDVCTYPKCHCPFDMGEEFKCFIGKKTPKRYRS